MSNTGKIKWFNPTKGFGFIDTGEEGKDIFLHVSALQESGIDQITEGEDVTYDIGENRGKPTAINIKKI
ncbi:MAG: cold shock domain-containing protein [Bacteroidetes bacterium]|jgi:CspA family cold shock protein|nr:cold shock domain-containing protein [Bacteroidota bacterium]